MAIHSTSRPSLQGRVLVRIPATFTATGGLSVTKANGVWTLRPDWSGLTELSTLLTPDSKDLWVWDPVTEVYNTMSIAALGASLFVGTSVTSNTIGTGAFTFATQAGKLWPVGGTLVISSDAAPSTDYLVATVTSYSAAGSLVVNVPAGGNHGSGAHTDWTISLSGATGTTGTTGSTGATGPSPAIGYTFSTTTTDSDPGAGIVRFNNATPASVTAIYFDNLDADANTVTAWLDSFDDSTATVKGTLTFTDETAPATKMIFSVSGTVVDGTGYRKVTVAHVSGATLFTNARRLAVVFSRSGDAGAGDFVGPGSSTSGNLVSFGNASGKLGADSGVVAANVVNAAAAFSTDNLMLRSDGTGRGAQNSPIVVADTTGALSRSGNGGIPIQGTNTNDNAAAGDIGEYISSSVSSGSAVSLTSPNAANITSISLTAGDWDVHGSVNISTAGTTVLTQFYAWISATSATLPTPPNGGSYSNAPTFSRAAGASEAISAGQIRFSLSGTTTIYLSTLAAFTVSTASAYGFIGARRVR